MFERAALGSISFGQSPYKYSLLPEKVRTLDYFDPVVQPPVDLGWSETSPHIVVIEPES
jgi:hypothetical protein